MKTVAGNPLRRPGWFFDISQQGEALSDVGTHLVDLVRGYCSRARRSTRKPQGRRADRRGALADRPEPRRLPPRHRRGGLSPTTSGRQLRRRTPAVFLQHAGDVSVRGMCVKLDVLWGYEAGPGGGDTHFAAVRGSRSRVEVRQRREERYRPEVYVVPNRPEGRAGIRAALRRKVEQLQTAYPGRRRSEEPRRRFAASRFRITTASAMKPTSAR